MCSLCENISVVNYNQNSGNAQPIQLSSTFSEYNYIFNLLELVKHVSNVKKLADKLDRHQGHSTGGRFDKYFSLVSYDIVYLLGTFLTFEAKLYLQFCSVTLLVISKVTSVFSQLCTSALGSAECVPLRFWALPLGVTNTVNTVCYFA
jgi:hypothetical protein